MDRVFIVTGAANGIGFACARRLLEDGYRVVLADIDKAKGQQAIKEMGFGDDEALFVECDISKKLEVHNLIAESLSAFGGIDGLINNAGIVVKGGALDLTEDDFDRVIATNLRGSFLVSKAVANYFVSEIESREDRSRLTDRPYSIVNMSSINDTVAIPDYLAYTVSKGGLLQLTKSMALELAPYGIRVNAIGPGSVKTDMLSDVAGDGLEKIYSRTPLGRLALPDEIAGVAAFLLDEDSSYITGQCIYVDGGRLALNYTMPKKQIIADI
jgi:NAD(P)-dependent dehydrogenase (short-subunit alcohol dehydrogenase family)